MWEELCWVIPRPAALDGLVEAIEERFDSLGELIERGKKVRTDEVQRGKLG